MEMELDVTKNIIEYRMKVPPRLWHQNWICLSSLDNLPIQSIRHIQASLNPTRPPVMRPWKKDKNKIKSPELAQGKFLRYKTNN